MIIGGILMDLKTSIRTFYKSFLMMLGEKLKSMGESLIGRVNNNWCL